MWAVFGLLVVLVTVGDAPRIGLQGVIQPVKRKSSAICYGDVATDYSAKRLTLSGRPDGRLATRTSPLKDASFEIREASRARATDSPCRANTRVSRMRRTPGQESGLDRSDARTA